MPINNTSIIAVPTDSLAPNPWNTNKLDATAYRKLRESIERLGVFKPVVVRELENGELEIIGGEHRWSVVNELGWDEIQVANVGCISDAEAKAISVLDNERFGEDDEIAFQRLLEDIQSDLDFDLADVMDVNFDLDQVLTASGVDADELLDGLDDDLDATPERSKEKVETGTDSKQTMRFRLDHDEASEIKNIVNSVIAEQGISTGSEFDDAGEAIYFIIKQWSAENV